jgi:hypothetical protein
VPSSLSLLAFSDPVRAGFHQWKTHGPDGGQVYGLADVPAGAFAADWIEALAAAGITTGCGGGNDCPGDATSRGQAAALLVRTFELE